MAWQDEEICVLILLCKEWTLSNAQIHELFNQALPGRRTMDATRLCSMYTTHAGNDQSGAMWFYWDRAEGPPFSRDDLDQFVAARTKILWAARAFGKMELLNESETKEAKFKTWLESDEQREARAGKRKQKLAQEAKVKVRTAYVPRKHGKPKLPNTVPPEVEEPDIHDSETESEEEESQYEADVKLLTAALEHHSDKLLPNVTETVNKFLSKHNRSFTHDEVSGFFRNRQRAVVAWPGGEVIVGSNDNSVVKTRELTRSSFDTGSFYQAFHETTNAGRQTTEQRNLDEIRAAEDDPEYGEEVGAEPAGDEMELT